MAKDMLNEFTPLVGGLTDEDIDLIMRCGGDNVKPELTLDEIPNALAVMGFLKEANKEVVELFQRFDVDKSGELPADQLKALLKEVNGGVDPLESDLYFILKQCEPRASADPIKLDQLKPALACWFILQEKTKSEKLKDTFDAADTKGNGVIEKDELKALLKSLKSTMTEAEVDAGVEAAFSEFDTNKSGVLEYDQFVDWVMATA